MPSEKAIKNLVNNKLENLTVSELKHVLRSYGRKTNGRKSVLVSFFHLNLLTIECFLDVASNYLTVSYILLVCFKLNLILIEPIFSYFIKIKRLSLLLIK